MPGPYALTYLAFGAGDDSTFMLMCSELGLHGVPRADVAIFADPGDENEYTYEHVWRLAERAERVPGAIPIHVASVRPGFSLVGFLSEAIAAGRNPTSQPPLWTLERGVKCVVANKFEYDEELDDEVERDGGVVEYEWRDQAGQLPRACTRDVKIRVAHRYVRKLLGVRAFRKGGPRVLSLIGIAADEVERVNVSREHWCDLAHPLVDAGIRKRDEAPIAAQHGWTLPGKSSCRACPYHGDDYWRTLKRDHPSDFERACQDDEALRRFPRMRAELFVHRSRVPLRTVKFEDARDAFGNDCSGTCGA